MALLSEPDVELMPLEDLVKAERARRDLVSSIPQGLHIDPQSVGIVP